MFRSLRITTLVVTIAQVVVVTSCGGNDTTLATSEQTNRSPDDTDAGRIAMTANPAQGGGGGLGDHTATADSGSSRGGDDGATKGNDGATNGKDGGTKGGDAAAGADDPNGTVVSSEPVFVEKFDTLKTGSAWLKGCKWIKHVHVTDGCGVAGSKCLRVAHDPTNTEPPLFPLPPVDERPPYPAGSTGVCNPYYTNTATDVVQDLQPIPAAEEYSLNYDVYFEPGYDWARGGKLPGLTAKEWDSGCSVEGDGISTDPGPARWSVRVMWRALGTNELYVYDQDRAPGACGLRSPTNVPFKTATWTAVTVYAKLNTKADLPDGTARLYLDGQLAREETKLRLRATVGKDSKISNIFFSTFFGGNESKRLYCAKNPDNAQYCSVKDPSIDVSWVPRTVSYIDFDNLAVYPGLRVRRTPGQ